MKTPAERGPIGAWAYEARSDADLSVEEVAERLTRLGQPVMASTIRGIEGGSKKPSRRLLKALAQVYRKPAPGEDEPQAAPTVDLVAVVAAIERQTAAVDRLVNAVGRLDGSVSGGLLGLADALGPILVALGGTLPQNGSASDVESDPGGPGLEERRNSLLGSQ